MSLMEMEMEMEMVMVMVMVMMDGATSEKMRCKYKPIFIQYIHEEIYVLV